MNFFSLILTVSMVLISNAQSNIKYESSIFKITHSDLEYSDENQKKVDCKGYLDYNKIYSKKEFNEFLKHIVGFPIIKICDSISSTLYSKTFRNYYNGISYEYKSYLHIHSKEPYKILVGTAKVEGMVSLKSFLQDNFLFIVRIENHSYDVVVEGEEEEVYRSFVCVEFQNDGTFRILEDKEAFKLLKKYKVMELSRSR